MVPSYGPGNSLYSTTDSLTAQDIENYFRIIPNKGNCAMNTTNNSTREEKTIQYLRPTSFEQEQNEKWQLMKGKVSLTPYATFHEK